MQDDFELPDADSLPASPDDDTASAYELDVVGAKTIELYQNHLSLLDRIWVYFSQYSALVFVLACGLAVLRANDVVKGLPHVVLALPLVVYVLLVCGNYKTLDLTLAELQIVKGVANTKTRFVFRGTKPSTILRFQVLLAIFVAGTYLVAWWLVRPWW